MTFADLVALYGPDPALTTLEELWTEREPSSWRAAVVLAREALG